MTQSYISTLLSCMAFLSCVPASKQAVSQPRGSSSNSSLYGQTTESSQVRRTDIPLPDGGELPHTEEQWDQEYSFTQLFDSIVSDQRQRDANIKAARSESWLILNYEALLSFTPEEVNVMRAIVLPASQRILAHNNAFTAERAHSSEPDKGKAVMSYWEEVLLYEATLTNLYTQLGKKKFTQLSSFALQRYPRPTLKMLRNINEH